MHRPKSPGKPQLVAAGFCALDIVFGLDDPAQIKSGSIRKLIVDDDRRRALLIQPFERHTAVGQQTHLDPDAFEPLD